MQKGRWCPVGTSGPLIRSDHSGRPFAYIAAANTTLEISPTALTACTLPWAEMAIDAALAPRLGEVPGLGILDRQ